MNNQNAALPTDTQFVIHRSARDRDRLGELTPEDTPDGWESLQVASRWDVVGLRKCIEHAHSELSDQSVFPDVHEFDLLPGERYLTHAADSYRAGNQLAKQRGRREQHIAMTREKLAIIMHDDLLTTKFTIDICDGCSAEDVSAGSRDCNGWKCRRKSWLSLSTDRTITVALFGEFL